MPTFEIFSLVVLASLAWFWFDSFQTHESAMKAARSACESEQLQLLDDSVSLGGLGLERNNEGQLTLRRTYDFEFSDTGDNRRKGSVVVLGHRVVVVNIGLRLVPTGTRLH